MSAPAIPPEVFAQVAHAWALQDYAEGERLLAEACRTHPDHFHLRTCHGAALGYCARMGEAKAAFDALIADAAPEKKLHMHGLLGVEWCRIGRHDLAIPLLEVAAGGPDPVPPIHEALADALEHMGRRDEAAAVADEGLRRHGNHPGIALVRARLLRQAGNLDLAGAALRKILDSPLASPEAKAKAGHEWGHVLDAQGRFAEAFAAFMAAKHERREALAPFFPIWKSQHAHLNNPANHPTREDFHRFGQTVPASSGPPPLAFLVGCPRSGTTLLERVLDAHPGVLSAPELPVFSTLWNHQLHQSLGKPGHIRDALDRLSRAQADAVRQAYRRRMEDALEEPVGTRLLLDKNPSHLLQLPVLACLFPEAKVLMALRDPRAIAWSCFTQYLPDNANSAAFHALPTTAAHIGAQLRFWLRLRDHLPGAWHETRYEDMVADMRRSAGHTLAFLGLEWREEMAQFHRNPRPVRSPTYAEAAKPIYAGALDKWRNYEPWLGDAFQSLDPVAAELGY